MKKILAFSLLEMLIALATLGILCAIAYLLRLTLVDPLRLKINKMRQI
jgi:prepilin-type N-terminal cleavage/methylation domain-containing protein